ncbi:hypothetical protein HTG_04345 [Natrinema mahii]|uniref:Uncharacterized protein n=1 Tax=Natrinema thermotolerans TaxID=121872 RepID=A0AAF0PBD5_9EURY|nr:hypothetical protein [Natrinema thermotolerans]OAQ54803.1 hypothetical protein HTG_04345 [Natrinema mahii]WMT06399.1 hypothetical protein NP511_13500 [Natrinema thermotolerans]
METTTNDSSAETPRIVLENFSEGLERDRIIATLKSAGIRREAIHVE